MSLLSKILMVYKFQLTFIQFDLAEYRHRLFGRRKMSPDKEKPIEGQVVVITGAGKGIGKASALEFAKRKATVVMACLNLAEGNKAMQEIKIETGNPNLELLHLDLSDMDSVQSFALAVARKYPKIKILFNNAGIGASTELKRTKEGFNKDVAVNYLGHFLLTNLLMDNLQFSGEARVVVMSSTAAMLSSLKLDDLMMEKSGTGFWGLRPLVNTYFANALFMKELAKRMKGKGVTTCAICPGAVKTDIWESGRTSKFKKAVLDFIVWIHGFTPEQTASEVIMYSALSKKLADKTGKFYRFKQNFSLGNLKISFSKLSDDLWKLSSQLVRLDERVLLFRNDLNSLNRETFVTRM